jgi:hypothetical protein
MGEVADYLGYKEGSRIYGKGAMDKVSTPTKTHAEQIILKDVGGGATGRIVPSRIPCDWNPSSKSVENCGAAIAAHQGVRLVGRWGGTG